MDHAVAPVELVEFEQDPRLGHLCGCLIRSKNLTYKWTVSKRTERTTRMITTLPHAGYASNLAKRPECPINSKPLLSRAPRLSGMFSELQSPNYRPKPYEARAAS